MHFVSSKDSKNGRPWEILEVGVDLPRSWFLKAALHWLQGGNLRGEAHFKLEINHLGKINISGRDNKSYKKSAIQRIET